MIEDFLWWFAEKIGSVVFVCVCVCVSVQTIWHLEHKRLGHSGLARHHSTRRNDKKTMVLIAERLVAIGTCIVPLREPLQKVVDKAAGQTN